MGKAAKQRRSMEKKRQKTNAKLARLAEYERKRGHGKAPKNAKAKKGAKVRDNSCRNIGDVLSHPEMLETLLPNYRMHHGMKLLKIPGYRHQGHTKYKGLLRELVQKNTSTKKYI